MSDNKFMIIDSHLDLSFSALQINRDLTQPAATIRVHDPVPVMSSFGSCTVSFPELRKGRVGIVFGTVMTRIDPNDRWTRTGMYTQAQCYGIGRGQLAYYQALEREGILRFIHNRTDLDTMVQAWEDPNPSTPIGLVLAMESTDSIVGPEQVEEWYGAGLRVASISHYGVSTYSHGTGTEGGLLPPAKPLLKAFRDFGIIVDMTHLTDQAFWEVLDIYDGPVLASHHNCRALVPGQRQLTDDMIKAIAERGGVIGASLDSWMLDTNWKFDQGTKQLSRATLQSVVDHIDHIAQLLGNTRHSGIGSDLDGGFGAEQTVQDLNTIADLQKLHPIFSSRGYSDEDIRNIFSGNWVRLLRETWST